MSKAQKGDLIRIVSTHAAFTIGSISEVCTVGVNGVYAVHSGEDNKFIHHSEYVIHQKAGEEDNKKDSPTKDAINPQHYKKGRVEVIDIIEDAVQGADPFEAVLQANIIKYTQRYRNKNGIEDLKKAQWYLNKLVAHLENK